MANPANTVFAAEASGKKREGVTLGHLLKSIDVHIQEIVLPQDEDRIAYTDIPIANIKYNSALVNPGDLFVCIKGLKSDGHNFAADAVARGAVVLAVERVLDGLSDQGVVQVVLDDSRLALALLAGSFYDHPSDKMQVCAVTGTNGKTTTTYLLEWICRYALSAKLLQPAGDCLKYTGLIGTVQTRLGEQVLTSKHTTPESSDLQSLLATMREQGVRQVAMEVSSHAIELKRVAGVNFTVAAFTNLTQDHLDFHETMDKYFEAKAALFDSKLVHGRVIDIDGEYGLRLLQRMNERGLPALTCGISEQAEIQAKNIVLGFDETSCTLSTPSGDYDLIYPLIGSFNVSNVLVAASMAQLLGISWTDIVAALKQCPQIPGRLERVYASAENQNSQDIAVFVDYCHTPDSIEKAVQALRAITKRGVVIVFGCGGDRDRGKRPLMAQAAMNANFAVVTSDNPRSEDPSRIIDDILAGLKDDSKYVVRQDRAEAIEYAINAAAEGDCVLIAGKGHEDYQILGDKVIDFDDRLVAAKVLGELS